MISQNDEDQDGIDDYSDILQGARAYIEKKPKYKSIYYNGGYPEDGIGVCTDVIWSAFQNAGFSLKDMVEMPRSVHLNPQNMRIGNRVIL